MYPTIILENFVDTTTLDLLLSSLDDSLFLSAPNNPNLFSFQIDNTFKHNDIINKININLKINLEKFYEKKLLHQAGGSIIKYSCDQYIRHAR